MVSEAERIDYKRGARDRKIVAKGKSIAPVPESDAYYRGIFGAPLEEETFPRPKSSAKRWGVAFAIALPVTALCFWSVNHSR